MLRLLHSTTLVEKVVLGLLSFIIVISIYQIGSQFYTDHSDPVPGSGGTYVEGVTGSFRFLNPVLAQTSLDRDVSSLVFCSLTRFDPVKNEVVDYAASHALSPDKRTYTFTLRDDLLWHDGVPVTADDVIFTFREVIQHEEFTNPALAADFADVLITKVDERTVTMTLKKQYAFFIYNTNIGLLPKHLLKDVSVRTLPAAEFNLKPIGCGPYRVEDVTNGQIRLTAFERFFEGRPYLDKVIFRLFGSEESLFKNLDGVTGTQDLSAEHFATLSNDARLALYEFNLPQYVALFFNTDRGIISNAKTRLGLQLALNKIALVESIEGKSKIIDTPLLEIDTSDWKYDFSAERADGALYDAGWRYTDDSTKPIVETVEASPDTKTNPAATSTETDSDFITAPSDQRYYATAEDEFFLEGTAPSGTTFVKVNNYQLKKFTTGTKTWSYKASANIGTLQTGENEYIVTTNTGELDRVTIFYSQSESARKAWLTKKLTPVVTANNTTVATKEKTKTSPTIEQTRLRRNSNGDALVLKLLVPADNSKFVAVAEAVKTQWHERGVNLIIEALPNNEFLDRLTKRDYDIVLFGQNLGYNLDTYPFWHSSEARKGGSNLSNIKSSGINAWLEQARSTFDSAERRKRLSSLRSIIAKEVPAIFLYTPVYTFAADKKIKNFNLGRIALRRDRLAGLSTWYFREERALRGEVGTWDFIKWFFSGQLW